MHPPIMKVGNCRAALNPHRTQPAPDAPARIESASG
jgi:hypothetical protein